MVRFIEYFAQNLPVEEFLYDFIFSSQSSSYIQTKKEENMNKNKIRILSILFWREYVIHIQVDTYNEYADEALSIYYNTWME